MRLCLIATFALISSGVLAHDQFGNANWIADGHYLSPVDGSHCCGVSDCAVVSEEYVRLSVLKGGYIINGPVTYGSGGGAIILKVDETVPFNQVHKSRDGQYWRCKKPDGSRRCVFVPPPNT